MSEATPRKLETAAVFGRSAEIYARVGPTFFPHFGRRLVEEARIRPGERVLDVAYGTGLSALPARDAGAEVLAVDLAPEMVAQCRAQGLEARVMDGEALELPDASVDVVLCGFGVFFFPDHARAFAEFRRVLQADGRLAFTTFTEEDDPRWEWQRKPKRDEPTESPLDSRDGLAGVVAAAGFAEPRFVEEDYTLVFADVDEWIAWQWSHGGRRELERKSEAELEAYRRDAAGHLAKLDPIGLTIHARIAVCEASG